MATSENNNARPQREAKKRAAAAMYKLHGNAAKKKRVVLGNLTNVSSNCVAVSEKENQEQEKVKREQPAAPVATPEEVEERNDPQFCAPYLCDPIATPEEVEERDDPQFCAPYLCDISEYEYLSRMEVDPSKRPLPDYVQKVQGVVDANMRGILVDWLVEVAEEYNLVSDTLYFCVAYIDRFLSLNALSRDKLQLLGVASMLIASKYEEQKAPYVEDFCYITDNTYSKEEVVNMEIDVLKALKFELGAPTVKTFLRRFSRVAKEGVDASDLQFEFLSCYVAELSLLDYDCIKFLPSLVAASVLFLVRFIFSTKTHPWNLKLHQLTRYKPADLKECVLNLHDLYLSRRGASLQAAREKYKQHKFKCVATTASPPEIPLSFFEFEVQIIRQL